MPDSPLPLLSLPPLHDTSTFTGRFWHFAAITDWRLCGISTAKLQEAQELLHQHKGQVTPTSAPELRRASAIYQSAFHPDTGDLQNIVGRMSFQVPGGMLLTGAMMAFYKSIPAVVFWQWANQSFNATVNYTNRNAGSELTTSQLAVAYTSATSAALVTAIGLKQVLATFKKMTLIQRYVPFMAVAAANVVNIPLMRQNELANGISITDSHGNVAGLSKVSAVKGISEVMLSRIVMAAPGMLVIPIIMRRVEKLRWFRPAYNLPMQTMLCGVSLTLMVPLACAIFDQKCPISASTIQKSEPDLYAQLQRKYGAALPHTFYFNKGL